jgi:hypothetical protein
LSRRTATGALCPGEAGAICVLGLGAAAEPAEQFGPHDVPRVVVLEGESLQRQSHRWPSSSATATMHDLQTAPTVIEMLRATDFVGRRDG